jgi:hypothetical protein
VRSFATAPREEDEDQTFPRTLFVGSDSGNGVSQDAEANVSDTSTGGNAAGSEPELEAANSVFVGAEATARLVSRCPLVFRF